MSYLLRCIAMQRSKIDYDCSISYPFSQFITLFSFHKRLKLPMPSPYPTLNVVTKLPSGKTLIVKCSRCTYVPIPVKPSWVGTPRPYLMKMMKMAKVNA